MKKLMLAVGLFAVAGSAFAAKPCEELKAEIDAKIKANGVPAYTLEIVDKGSVTDKKVVGTCDGGTKHDAGFFVERFFRMLMLAVGLFAVAGSAFAAKPCEELKAEIDAKIKANGVPAYTLEIVDKGSVTDKKVVGTCDGGTKEIVYQRG